jgi:hypothetical protein
MAQQIGIAVKPDRASPRRRRDLRWARSSSSLSPAELGLYVIRQSVCDRDAGSLPSHTLVGGGPPHAEASGPRSLAYSKAGHVPVSLANTTTARAAYRAARMTVEPFADGQVRPE